MPHREQFASDEAFQKALRDYMAAKAMQGIMASGRWDVVGANIITSEAYEIADAMIKAREAS